MFAPLAVMLADIKQVATFGVVIEMAGGVKKAIGCVQVPEPPPPLVSANDKVKFVPQVDVTVTVCVLAAPTIVAAPDTVQL